MANFFTQQFALNSGFNGSVKHPLPTIAAVSYKMSTKSNSKTFRSLFTNKFHGFEGRLGGLMVPTCSEKDFEIYPQTTRNYLVISKIMETTQLTSTLPILPTAGITHWSFTANLLLLFSLTY